MVEIPMKKPEDVLYWLEFSKRNGVPFVGLTDDPNIATSAGEDPKHYRERLEGMLKKAR